MAFSGIGRAPQLENTDSAFFRFWPEAAKNNVRSRVGS
jgi:hypothetical protein